MARRLLTLALIGIGLGMTGCVSMDKYKAVEMELQQATERAALATSEAAKQRTAADAYKQQLDALLANSGNLGEVNAALNSENSQLKSQFAILKQRYDDAMAAGPNIVVQGGTALPAPQSNALAEFARLYPELLEFDASRGVVKFKSDVTFATGSADLSPRAKEAVAKFGKLLNSETFRNYDFFVAGHTDNSPVSNPNTIRLGHKDNWFLSGHRAISVLHEMVAEGIAPSRVGFQGFADQRPAASNATIDGKAKNRRVEVVILPSTTKGGAIQTAANPVTPVRAAPAPVIKRPDFNKDSTTTLDRTPLLNK